MIEQRIKFYADHVGKSCDGCKKCCEGWLTTKVFDFEIGPGIGGCRFLGSSGCNVYQVRPYDPCKVFQCGWKENSNIPDFMKPDLSNVILLVRYVEDIHFYRIVKCGSDLTSQVSDWAKAYSKLGNHLIAYDNDGRLLIYSESRRFRELARKYYSLGGIL